MQEVELPNPDELEEIKEMLLAQQQSSDQWAFYQAKVIREHLYRAQKLTLEMTLAEPGALKGPARAKVEALAKKFGDEEKRYNAEKKEIEMDAKRLEHERDRNRDKDPYFDYAEVLLQISIVMASVSILAASRPMYSFATTAALLGTVLTLNGYLLLFRIPFFHH
jgi:hypothetical protein